MGLSDALTITGLGMAVVFSGLFLTAALILSFSFVPRIFARRPDDSGSKAAPSPSSPAEKPAEVPPQIVAVITAVLEVERRLYHADPGGRLTINRHREARS